MERASRRVNSAYYNEVYDAFWAQKNFVKEDIKRTMDARYDQYVREFGLKPEEYFDTPEYFQKYGNDEAVWHSWVKNVKRPWPTQGIRLQEWLFQNIFVIRNHRFGLVLQKTPKFWFNLGKN